jgi:hypothetical protein
MACALGPRGLRGERSNPGWRGGAGGAQTHREVDAVLDGEGELGDEVAGVLRDNHRPEDLRAALGAAMGEKAIFPRAALLYMDNP